MELTTITRTYKYKLNCGGYETRDFECSQSMECTLDNALEVSQKVYLFCRDQVIKAVKQEVETLGLSKKVQ